MLDASKAQVHKGIANKNIKRAPGDGARWLRGEERGLSALGL